MNLYFWTMSVERSTLDCAAAVRDCQYFSPSPGERFQPFEVSFVGDIFTQTLPFHLEQQSGAVKKAEIRLKLDTSRANLQFFESASSWKSSNFEGGVLSGSGQINSSERSLQIRPVFRALLSPSPAVEKRCEGVWI